MKMDSASVDDTSQVDIGLIVFWQVRPGGVKMEPNVHVTDKERE